MVNSLLKLVKIYIPRVGVCSTRQVYFVSHGLYTVLHLNGAGEFGKWCKERWTTTGKSYHAGTCTEQICSSLSDRGIAFQYPAFQTIMQVFQLWVAVCIQGRCNRFTVRPVSVITGRQVAKHRGCG